MNKCFLALLYIVVMSQVAGAQSRLTGTITDTSGAIVAGATVMVKNAATGQVTSGPGQTGVYSIPFLNPGEYEVSCEQTGFRKFLRSGIVLETGTTTTINITLDVGSVTETINVTAAAPLLETESGAVGQLIENKMILNMPIQSRRGGALVRLMGNVTFTGEEGGQSIPRFSIAGGRSYNQMWQIDGGVAQNQANGSPQVNINPPNEALQEFKVLANNFSAEYGRAGSGLILMTTRSGTNEFHGAAYEWLRNDKLNARTFFAADKAPLRYNIFGASIGGPIRRNKTFFFYNYEGGRRRTGVTIARNVPRPAEVNGDFSARTDIRILDPATRVGTTAAQPFIGNIIPANRIDPVGKALAAMFPAPNQPTDNIARAPSNNYRANGSDKLTQDFHTFRVDHQFGSKDRLSGRFIYINAPEEVAAVIPIAAADDRAGPRENRNKNFVANWNRILRPSLINEFRYSYGNRHFLSAGSGTGSGLNGTIGLKGVEADALARVTLTGHSALGQSGHLRIQDPIKSQQFIDNLMWLRGGHSLKVGAEWRYSENKETNRPSMGGSFAFTDRATNSAIASLLLGWTASAQIVDTDVLNARGDYYGAYVQDDWKVTSRLTLNLGLRWEIDTPRWERNNRQSGFDPTAINPVSGTPGVVTFAGLNGVSKYSHDHDWNNFGPRFGFAYILYPGFVLRGGYGIAYNGAYQESVNNQMALGFSKSGSFTSPDGGFIPAFLLRDGMPTTARPDLGPGFGAVRAGQPVTTAPDFIGNDHVNGYAQQWNLTVQKQLPLDMMIEAAYIAAVGHKLSGPSLNINQIPLVNGRGPAVQSQTLRPFPQFGNVTSIAPSWGNSTYHSMNAKLDKRFSRGLNILANYTWSKFIDDVEGSSELGGGQGNGYQHIQARGLDKALSGSDVRHRLAASTLYDLPFGKGRHWAIGNRFLDQVAGGWTLGGILEVRSGPPYGVIESTNRLNTFSDSQRPNLLRDPALPADRPRAQLIEQYFDTTAFQAPGDGVLGTAGRVNGIGPGFFGLDMSVQKLFRVSERFGLTFRTDVVNAPNVPAFALPTLLRGDGNFGKIGSTLGSATAREIQLSLRLAW
jgi:outer membrane receptor protein involved in Fe transport